MKRRLAFKLLAGTFALGGFVFQLGGCLTMATNTGAASFDTSILLDQQGRLFGVFAVCGTPNTLVLASQDAAVGTVINFEDDLVVGCPISDVVVSTTGTGGGGSGGAGT